MGARSNVFIQMHKTDAGWQGIGLYSHWGGMSEFGPAIDAARAAKDRLGDEAYFARRVLQNLMNVVADPDSPTGHGLWFDGVPDNEYPVLVINAETGLAWTCEESYIHHDAPPGAEHIDTYTPPTRED